MAANNSPWFQNVRRWAQIHIQEHEISRVDVNAWADLWSRWKLDGVTIYAGGPYATYPTRIPLHRRATGVDRRDLFGELAAAAKDRGLRVLAGIDPSRASAEVYFARPDGFFLGADGQPRRDEAGNVFTCINTPYYWEFIPSLFTELVERYPVDGFFVENWRGYGLRHPMEASFSAASVEKYRLQKSSAQPDFIDLKDPNSRQWIQWRHDCLRDVWLHWDDTIKLFRRDMALVGTSNADSLVELADIGAAVVEAGSPVWGLGEQARLSRALNAGEKRFIAGVDIHQEGGFISRSPDAVHAALAESAASGAIPCARFSGASLQDRRAFSVIEQFFQTQVKNDSSETIESLATVAVIVSERTQRFYDGEEGKSEAHVQGAMAALVRAGIPFDVVHDTQIQLAKLRRYRVLVLPNVACLSADACDVLWEFGSDGGGLVVTFETSICDEWGVYREDYGMTERLGVKLMRPAPVELGPDSYFRISSEHESLSSLGETSLLAGGGRFLAVELQMDHKTPLQIAPFVLSEASTINCERSQAPAMVAGPSGKGRVVYFPTEPDRLYWEDENPDHADLLAAAVRWAHRGPLPVERDGPAWVDVHAYRHGNDLLIHLVSVNAPGSREGKADGIASMRSQQLRIQTVIKAAKVELLVSGKAAAMEISEGGVTVSLPEVGPYEVVALREVTE